MWSDGVAPTDKWYWCRTRNTAMQGHKTNDKIKVRWQSKDSRRKMRDMGYGWCRTRHNKPCWINRKSGTHLYQRTRWCFSPESHHSVPCSAVCQGLKEGEYTWIRNLAHSSYCSVEVYQGEMVTWQSMSGDSQRSGNKTKWQDNDRLRLRS